MEKFIILLFLYLIIYVVMIRIVDLDNEDKWYHFVILFFLWPFLVAACILVCGYWMIHGLLSVFNKPEIQNDSE